MSPARQRILTHAANHAELDRVGREALQAALKICRVVGDVSGKSTRVEVPRELTLPQAQALLQPVKHLNKEGRLSLLRQLQRIDFIGRQLANLYHSVFADPVVQHERGPALGLLRENARRDGVSPHIIAAFDSILPAMTARLEGKTIRSVLETTLLKPHMVAAAAGHLRQCAEDEIDAPAVQRNLEGLRPFFRQARSGTFCFPGPSNRQPAPPVQQLDPSLFGSSVIIGGGMGTSSPGPESTPLPSLPQMNAGENAEPRKISDEWCDAVPDFSQESLSLPPEEFASLCRTDPETWRLSHRLGRRVEGISTAFVKTVGPPFANSLPGREGGGEVWVEDDARAIWHCNTMLANEMKSLRQVLEQWTQRDIPSPNHPFVHSLGAIVERSVVGGLFLSYLQKRFPDLFRDIPDEDYARPERVRFAKDMEMRQLTILQGIGKSLDALDAGLAKASGAQDAPFHADAARSCREAFDSFYQLFLFAATVKKREAGIPSCGNLDEPMPRFASVLGVCDEDDTSLPHTIDSMEYEPGQFPPLKFMRHSRGHGGMPPRQVRACWFSPDGDVDLGPSVAVPVAALFGEDSRLASVARFMGRQGMTHLKEWPSLSRHPALRPCLPSLAQDGAQLTFAQIRGDDCCLSLLALPSDAAQISGLLAPRAIPFAEAATLMEENIPPGKAVLRSLEERWKCRKIPLDSVSLCLIGYECGKEEEEGTDMESEQWRTVRCFLNQRHCWHMQDAKEVLATLGACFQPRQEGRHCKLSTAERSTAVQSAPFDKGTVYATTLHNWITTLGKDAELAALIETKDSRLAKFLRGGNGH